MQKTPINGPRFAFRNPQLNVKPIPEQQPGEKKGRRFLAHVQHDYSHSKSLWISVALAESGEKSAAFDRAVPLIECLATGRIYKHTERVATSHHAAAKRYHWFTFVIPTNSRVFSDYRLGVYTEEGLVEQKLLSCGQLLRKRIASRINAHLQKFLKIPKSVEQRILAKYNPVVCLHLWDATVAMEILGSFSRFAPNIDLRVGVPVNLSQQSRDFFFGRVGAYQFRSVRSLDVPAVGRDIGGFVTQLQASLADKDYSDRAHLFLHTKNTPHLPMRLRTEWRSSLVGDITAGNNFVRALSQFGKANTALVYSRRNQRIEDEEECNTLQEASLKLACQLGNELFGIQMYSCKFCAGTMMWLIPSRVASVWDASKLKVVESRLEDSSAMTEPSMGHAFERLFPEALRRNGIVARTI